MRNKEGIAKPLFAPPFRPPNQDDPEKEALVDALGVYHPEIGDMNLYPGIGDVPGTPQPKTATPSNRPSTSNSSSASGAAAVSAAAAAGSSSIKSAPFFSGSSGSGGDSPTRRAGIKSLPPSSSSSSRGERQSSSNERHGRNVGNERDRGDVAGRYSSSSHDKRKEEKYHNSKSRDSSSASSSSYDRSGKNDETRSE